MKTTEKEEMSTLVSCTQMLDKKGFTAQFKAIDKGLKSLTSDKVYTPEQVKVVNFYRFEGESSPSESAILYAIETDSGEQGTLVDAYGAYSDTNVSNFMTKVDEIEKKKHKDT
jgi:hypothetical protein